jgi:hypothetical protein
MLSREFDFAQQVVQASAVLTGYESAFSESDHHFGRLTITLSQGSSAAPEGCDRDVRTARLFRQLGRSATKARFASACSSIMVRLWPNQGPRTTIEAAAALPVPTFTSATAHTPGQPHLNQPASRYCALLRGAHIAFDPRNDDHHLSVMRAEVSASRPGQPACGYCGAARATRPGRHKTTAGCSCRTVLS